MDNINNKSKVRSALKIAAMILVLALTVLSLCGCLFKSELLDKQLELFVSAMNADDPALLYEGIHPEVDREDFYIFFEQTKLMWQQASPSDFRMTNLQIQTGGSKSYYSGVWNVKFDDETYILGIAYDSDEKGAGISSISFYLSEGAGTVSTVIGIVIIILCAAFIIFTVIDILRKKPRKYALMLILAVFLTLYIRINAVSVTLPLGSILYWALRKRLLRENKAAGLGN